MTLIWQRRVEVLVGPPGEQGRIWHGGGLHQLRVQFECRKTADSDPNVGSATIYNLNEDSRAYPRPGMILEIRAGYGESVERIFRSEITHVESVHRHNDWRTVIECCDGKTALDAPAVEAFAPGAGPGQMVQNLVSSFRENGVSTEFLTNIISQGKDALSSVVFDGDLRSAMDELTAQAGVRWSVQDNALVIADPDGAIDRPGVLLSPETGLEGSVEQLADGIKALSRLNGGIEVYRRLIVEARGASGVYVPRVVEHYGDTHGQSWNTELEAV